MFDNKGDKVQPAGSLVHRTPQPAFHHPGFVRTADDYQKLATRVFTRIQSNIRHDLLRIPYTLMILKCTR
jgi:hypothetical protein